MSPSTATRTWGRAVPVRPGSRRVQLAIHAVVVGVAAVALAQTMQEPAKAPPITIDNPNDYAITIETSGQGPDGWVTIAIVEPKSSTVAREVVDQGSSWSLRFTSQGEGFAGYQIDRSDLAGAGWTYAVPTDIGGQLAEAGMPPSP
jgi:hypothetical protein